MNEIQFFKADWNSKTHRELNELAVSVAVYDLDGYNIPHEALFMSSTATLMWWPVVGVTMFMLEMYMYDALVFIFCDVNNNNSMIKVCYPDLRREYLWEFVPCHQPQGITVMCDWYLLLSYVYALSSLVFWLRSQSYFTVSEAHSFLLQIIHQIAHAKTTVICHNFMQLCWEHYQPTLFH